MNRNVNIVLSIALALVAAGCTSHVSGRGSFVYFDQGNPIPEDAAVSQSEIDRVQVLYKQEPDRPYVEVGVVEAVVEGYRTDATLSDLFPELKRQGARMRVDAIHKIEIQRYDHAGDAMHATGIAIRFKD